MSALLLLEGHRQCGSEENVQSVERAGLFVVAKMAPPVSSGNSLPSLDFQVMTLSVLNFRRPQMMCEENDECSEDEDTFNLVKQVLSRNDRYSFKSSSRLERELKNIVKHLNKCADLNSDFLQAFQEWEHHRKKSISYLDDAITELDNLHFKTNIAKTTASVGGIVSGLIGVASVAAMFLGKNASPLQLTAAVGNLVSCAVSNCAVVTEMGLSKTYVDKAKLILEQDGDRFKPIQKLFKRTEDLKNAIEKVCTCDIILDVFRKLMIVVPLVKDTCDCLSSQIEGVVAEILRIILRKNITHNDVEKIVLLCAAICRNRELLETIRNIHQMIRNTPCIMPVVTLLVKVPCELKFLKRYMHESDRNPAVKDKESTNTAAITHGIFQGINVAVELFSLSLLVEDFQRGSPSEQSTILMEVKQHLEVELSQVSEVYNRLTENS